MKNLRLFLIFTFIINFSYAQSPWTRQKNKAFMQIGFSAISFNQITNNNGKVAPLGATNNDYTTQIYSEYGITDKLEAQFILPFKTLSVSNSFGKNTFSGIGNITLGIKYKIYNDNWKISAGLQVTPRTGKYSEITGLSTGFNANTFLPYISAGSSNGKLYYYSKLGYGYMDNKYSDFLNITLESGYEVIRNGHVIAVVDFRKTIIKEDAFSQDPKQTNSYPDQQEYTAFGIKTNYEFLKDKLGANFAVYGALGAKNTPYAPSINFGLYAKI